MKAMSNLQKGLSDSLAAQRAVSDAERSLIAEGLKSLYILIDSMSL